MKTLKKYAVHLPSCNKMIILTETDQSYNACTCGLDEALKESEPQNIFQKATQYAFICHAQTNHLYDKILPYSYHLNMVDDEIMRFKHLVAGDKLLTVRAGGRTHDCIEDCRQTYNNVKDATNEDIAEIAYALTNEKGKTRKERGNDKYYQGMRDVPFAIFIKICDRIANVTYSKQKGSSMFDKYKKENKSFKDYLFVSAYKEMFDHLDKLFNE